MVVVVLRAQPGVNVIAVLNPCLQDAHAVLNPSLQDAHAVLVKLSKAALVQTVPDHSLLFLR